MSDVDSILAHESASMGAPITLVNAHSFVVTQADESEVETWFVLYRHVSESGQIDGKRMRTLRCAIVSNDAQRSSLILATEWIEDETSLGG